MSTHSSHIFCWMLGCKEQPLPNKMGCEKHPSHDDEEDEGPQEDDYISYDGVTWYMNGKQIFRCDGKCEEPHNMWAHLAAYAAREKWWPNAWIISDHGNAHLVEY